MPFYFYFTNFTPYLKLKNIKMKDLLYNVQDLFQNYLKEQKCNFFNIPEYQRGYKWTSNNVKQLLEDLKHFQKTSPDSFYCLQNITVTKAVLNNNPCLNVIDGQQRLTTLFIIISFIQRNFAKKIISEDAEIIKYSVRTSTDEFLHKKIQSGTLWNNEIDPTAADFKDQYYIMEVAKEVQEWLNDNPDCHMETTLLKDLKLIINEVDSGEEETVFASLNGGKVDLDGADLMRAILITRAAKQKYPIIISRKNINQIENSDFNLNIDISLSSQGKINEFRVKLGIELDRMSLWWSDKEVRSYYEQLLPNRISQNKSFKYSDYPIDLLYYAFFEAYKDKFSKIEGIKLEDKDLSLRYFENGIDLNNKPGDDHLEFYKELKEFHMTLVDWYYDDEIFDLVGYLMYNYKSNIITFGLLWNKVWKTCNTKNEFKVKLKRLIRYEIAIGFSDESIINDEEKLTIDDIIEGKTNSDIDARLINLRESILDTSNTDWYNNKFTIKLLPLLDILPFTLVVGKKSKRLSQSYLRRTSSEDKEHVRSQKREIDENKMTEEDVEYLKEENRRGLNSLGNIVLLHESINKSYHNDPLIMKMVRIYSEHIQDDINAYIRPHTFNVFMSKLKDIKQNGVQDEELFWSDEDIKRTVKDIDLRLSDYLRLPSIENN